MEDRFLQQVGQQHYIVRLVESEQLSFGDPLDGQGRPKENFLILVQKDVEDAGDLLEVEHSCEHGHDVLGDVDAGLQTALTL